MSNEFGTSTKLTKKESVLKSANSQTAYNFYSSKYDNLIVHFESILAGLKDPSPGLTNWLSKMRVLSFDMFCQILEHQGTDYTADDIINEFAKDEGFSLDIIQPDDLTKIKRYIELFQTMGL